MIKHHSLLWHCWQSEEETASIVFTDSAASFITHSEFVQWGNPKLWPISCNTIFLNRCVVCDRFFPLIRNVDAMQLGPGLYPRPNTPQSEYLSAGNLTFPSAVRLVVDISLAVTPTIKSTESGLTFFRKRISVSARYRATFTLMKACFGAGLEGRIYTRHP